MSKLEKILKDLNTTTTDVRAEVLLAQAMEAGLLQHEFTVQTDGFFYRTHTNDLYKKTINDDTSYKNFLALYLSRQGLYDALPEGLFFQSEPSGKGIKSAIEMGEEYRRNKKKENEVRKFFAPFEHEFFLQTLKNEIVETGLLQGLRSGWLKEYFIDFWKLPQNIPVNAALLLVIFLPHAHRIAGDMEASAAVLQKILNEKVAIDVTYASDTDTDAAFNILGSYKLGGSLTCGESFKEQYPLANIHIGPLQKTKAYQYVEGGNYFSLLQTFYNYFIPATMEIKTIILLKTDAEKLILNEMIDVPLLGISSVL